MSLADILFTSDYRVENWAGSRRKLSVTTVLAVRMSPREGNALIMWKFDGARYLEVLMKTCCIMSRPMSDDRVACRQTMPQLSMMWKAPQHFAEMSLPLSISSLGIRPKCNSSRHEVVVQ